MKIHHHIPRRLTALFLVMAVMLSLVPSAFAGQEDSYHDPAEHWQEALNRTNELDANSVVTIETFNCCVCGQATSFQVFRVPEYTRNGETALTRNVKYSDGTCLDGESKGDLLDGTPGKDATYTGYHWTKAVCEVCGTLNSNMGATSYACDKNVYWLYDCAANFFEKLPETQTIEQVDGTYHRVTTTSGEYCGFCYGTFKEENSTLVRHNMESAIRPELAHDRFVEMDTCADCGYAETAYTAAKSVVADYFGVADGQPHTVTVSDLSEAGVTTAIRYGQEANSCTLTSAPNYTEAGDYPVYYEITYTYKNTDMVEDGVAFVHLRDETTAADGSCTCGCGNPDCGCQDPDCDGCCCDDKGCGGNHNWVLLERVDPTCLTLGYPSFHLTNNNANIRRVQQRIDDLKNRGDFVGWAFPGGTAEINEGENRLQLFFDEKPTEEQRRELKSNGFKWAPSQGAWQRQLNRNAIFAAGRMDFLKTEDGQSPVRLQPFARQEREEPSR